MELFRARGRLCDRHAGDKDIVMPNQADNQKVDYFKRAMICEAWAEAQSDLQLRQPFLDMAEGWRILASRSAEPFTPNLVEG
jgi:hypothetical protein